jgi:hypothetical protein
LHGSGRDVGRMDGWAGLRAGIICTAVATVLVRGAISNLYLSVGCIFQVFSAAERSASVRHAQATGIVRHGPMKRHVKHYLVLVAAQVACLALGLWLEQRFVLAVAPAQDRPGQNASATIAEGAAKSGSPEGISAGPPFAEKPETAEAAIRLLAFSWIAALQALVAYLVLTRAQDQN